MFHSPNFQDHIHPHRLVTPAEQARLERIGAMQKIGLEQLAKYKAQQESGTSKTAGTRDDSIGILDTEFKNPNPLNGKPYSEQYRNFFFPIVQNNRFMECLSNFLTF
jgi:hypothetical protein